jgi:transcriptional regulator with XRE-family HTH domain
MRDLELGRLVRALRRRRRWRQEDCAARAGVHRSTWSNLERGQVGGMAVKMLRRCLSVLELDVDLVLRGDRASHERLMDERHASMETHWTVTLRRRGWHVWAEHSFSHFGERGRVDLLAWHPPTRILAVFEIKTELADSQALLGILDAKVRLGPVLARQLGLPTPARIVPVLIFAESMTNRRRVRRIEPLLERFDVRGAAARSWLRWPSGGSGLLFFSGANASRARDPSPHRVRLPAARLSVKR